jgi:hypothetical protein
VKTTREMMKNKLEEEEELRAMSPGLVIDATLQSFSKNSFTRFFRYGKSSLRLSAHHSSSPLPDNTINQL